MNRLKNAIRVRWQLITLWMKVRKRIVHLWLYQHVWFPYRLRYHRLLIWLSGILSRWAFELNDKARTWMWKYAQIYPPMLDRYGNNEDDLVERY